MSGAILATFGDGSTVIVDVVDLERWIGPSEGFVEQLVELGLAVEVIDGLVQLKSPSEVDE
jgi:hypothetical protein